MTRRRQDTPATIRREAAQRTEGVREAGVTPLAVYRSPMVRGGARGALILAALQREGLVPEVDALAEDDDTEQD